MKSSRLFAVAFAGVFAFAFALALAPDRARAGEDSGGPAEIVLKGKAAKRVYKKCTCAAGVRVIPVPGADAPEEPDAASAADPGPAVRNALESGRCFVNTCKAGKVAVVKGTQRRLVMDPKSPKHVMCEVDRDSIPGAELDGFQIVNTPGASTCGPVVKRYFEARRGNGRP